MTGPAKEPEDIFTRSFLVMKLIDAYAHVGLPRFASAADALHVLKMWNIEKANLVLFPGCPDFESMKTAREVAGDRVRLFGVPYGATDEQRLEMIGTQIGMGVSGFRFMPFEIQPNLPGLERIGEAGLWLMLINPFQNDATIDFALSWLERYPNARIASPHFMNLCPLPELDLEQGPLNQLLEHPRFVVILSRHGGASKEPYPHDDLGPWLDSVLERVDWSRILWGSEFPVLHQRDEVIVEARDWIRQRLPGLTREQANAFYHDNAERLFFSESAPADTGTPLPTWFSHEQGQGKPLPLLAPNILPASVPLACKVNHHYFHANRPENPIRKSEFALQNLERGLDSLNAQE